VKLACLVEAKLSSAWCLVCAKAGIPICFLESIMPSISGIGHAVSNFVGLGSSEETKATPSSRSSTPMSSGGALGDLKPMAQLGGALRTGAAAVLPKPLGLALSMGKAAMDAHQGRTSVNNLSSQSKQGTANMAEMNQTTMDATDEAAKQSMLQTFNQMLAKQAVAGAKAIASVAPGSN
jgi:hypothetical protein